MAGSGEKEREAWHRGWIEGARNVLKGGAETQETT